MRTKEKEEILKQSIEHYLKRNSRKICYLIRNIGGGKIMELFNVLNRKNKVNSNKNIFKNRSEIHFKVKAKKLFYSRPALYLLNTKGIS